MGESTGVRQRHSQCLGKPPHLFRRSTQLHRVPLFSRRVRFTLYHFTKLNHLTLSLRIKALLFTLIRAFEFEEAAKDGIVRVTVGILQRPAVRAEGPGSGLPLIVKPYNVQL